jgi:membrane-associated protein
LGGAGVFVLGLVIYAGIATTSYSEPKDPSTIGPLIALLKIPSHLGYLALGDVVGLETMGLPLPGETALIAAAVLANQGQLQISIVIAVAAASAIVGDNVGYFLGRRGGRRVLQGSGPFHGYRQRLLQQGERFFARHGAKAVFLGRWVTGLRITAAWLAGTNRMPWRTFVFWNACGGVAWAVSVGLAAYFLGAAGGKVLATLGGVAAATFLVTLLAAAFAWRRRRRRARARGAGVPRR